MWIITERLASLPFKARTGKSFELELHCSFRAGAFLSTSELGSVKSRIYFFKEFLEEWRMLRSLIKYHWFLNYSWVWSLNWHWTPRFSLVISYTVINALIFPSEDLTIVDVHGWIWYLSVWENGCMWGWLYYESWESIQGHMWPCGLLGPGWTQGWLSDMVMGKVS